MVSAADPKVDNPVRRRGRRKIGVVCDRWRVRYVSRLPNLCELAVLDSERDETAFVGAARRIRWIGDEQQLSGTVPGRNADQVGDGDLEPLWIDQIVAVPIDEHLT